MSQDPPGPATPASAQPPERRTALRGLSVLALVTLLLFAAFVGGALVTGAWHAIGGMLAPESTTTLRPQTSVVVAVRDLSRLETTSFHMERVIELTEKQRRLYGLVEAEDTVLLVAAADVTAGVDLSKIAEGDVIADRESGSVSITLPAPQILTTRLDNENTYVHTRDTDVLAKRRNDLESRARQQAETKLRDAALDAGILDRAREGGERAVEALLRSLGYDEVTIRWQ